MATKKRAGKKAAAKKRAAKRRNDPLRQKLEGVLRAIEDSHPTTQAFVEVQSVRDALPLAIQKLKDNPGPVQSGTG